MQDAGHTSDDHELDFIPDKAAQEIECLLVTPQALVWGQAKQIVQLAEVDAKGGGFFGSRPPNPFFCGLHQAHCKLFGDGFRAGRAAFFLFPSQMDSRSRIHCCSRTEWATSSTFRRSEAGRAIRTPAPNPTN